LKKKFLFLVVFPVIVFFFTFCGKKYDDVKFGISLIPKETETFFVFNAKRARDNGLFEVLNSLKITNNPSLKTGKKELSEFFKETGIDFKKSLNYLIVTDISHQGFILSLTYQEERLVSYLKEKKLLKDKSSYNEYNIYALQNFGPNFNDQHIIFIEDSIITIGSDVFVKKVTDNFEGKGDNILSKENMKNNLKKIDDRSILWGIADFQQNYEKIAKDFKISSPLNTDDFRKFLFYIDLQNSLIKGQFILVSKDSSNNKNIVDMLNGFKAILSSGKKELSKILDNINFNSKKDEIIMDFSIPHNDFRKIVLSKVNKYK